ncbi:Protein CBR-HLH-6 [Caenorhabditis briggsae]|uniref:Protein CBR-HLH-6 n=1 Tax=Caenorhabditis briggsae TaxID=6238 RepID=A8X2T8_CAEBR|nr:Protein CBR-HLH-6 [Caenorhabditis briggsae]CAP26948.2 Protein CBR-HLH-6 [Caenorhabditis briggsae]
MFPVTYSFENGVYSTIINQTPNAHGLNGLDQDVGKLMVPILETPQAHIPQLMELQQPQQTQIQHEIPLQPPCSLSSSIFSQPQISQTSTTSSAASSSSQKKYVNPFAPEATVPLPIELEDQFGPYRNVNDGYEKLRRHLPVHFE